ncbi:MAG TPA: hypothetical protein VNM15_02165 [Candidatus Binatia bacterium]|nr:hypothetical protein [Candidatus Binatia bacterium]
MKQQTAAIIEPHIPVLKHLFASMTDLQFEIFTGLVFRPHGNLL